VSQFTCPDCGSADTVDTTRYERCNRCGYEVYYGDAHAADPQARQSRVTPGGRCHTRQEEGQ
jgi:uncharacterized protein (DUF983 family)